MIVNLFWDSQPLSRLEMLTIVSFSTYASQVNIFTYDLQLFKEVKISNVNIFDARDIIEESKRFYYTGNGDCPKNSVVGFSDIFRYALLHKVGEWYVDFDVTCLQSFQSLEVQTTIIRPHSTYGCISNICRFQKGDNTLLQLREQTEQLVSDQNNDWCKPLQIFSDVVSKVGYSQYITAVNNFGTDDFTEVSSLLNGSILSTTIQQQYAIHWCRSALTSGKWSASHFYDINNPHPGTHLSLLYRQFSC